MRFRRSLAIALAAALLLAVAGATIVADRPGLRADYFALTDSWQGEPIFARVSLPRVEQAEDLTRIFQSLEFFSIRWRGWMVVETSGTHGFAVAGDDGAYLRVDDEMVVDRSGGMGDAPSAGAVELEPGLHRIEIGLAQSGGPTHLKVLVTPPGAAQAELTPDALWASRPGPLRSLTRGVLASRSLLERRLLGASLLLASLMLLLRVGRSGEGTLALWGRAVRALEQRVGKARLRRGAVLVILALLGAAAYRFGLRLAGSPLGGDDVRYLDIAFSTGGARGWLVDRYVHIYLVKAWQALFPGDVFLAARHYWAILGTVTVLAVAVGALSLGRGLQVGTLAVTLWLLAGQSVLFGTAGTMWSDYTAMAFISVAVAVLLHRLALQRPPRWELHALALGALTLGAMRSKATGAVLVWLVLSFLWENGRLDLRRFGRKVAFWLVGVAAAQVLVMALDASVLGDAWFSTRSHSHQAVGEVHLDVVEPESQRYGWFEQVWPRRVLGHFTVFEFFPLGLLVVGALAAAAATRQKPERLVVHLLPSAYLGALLLLQLWSSYGALSRHLLPIVPVSALLGATLFHYAGLDRLTWREATAPRFLAPLFAIVFLFAALVIPGINAELAPEQLTPLAAGPEAGWSSTRIFSQWALVPALLALTALAAPRAVRWRGGRLLLLLTLCLLMLGNETADTARLVATRRPAQRSAMILYPWTAFDSEIRGKGEIVISPHLIRGEQGFFGPKRTAQRLGRLYLREPNIGIRILADVGAETDLAFGTAADVERWERDLPGLAETVVAEPLGRIFVVRPRQSATGEEG